MSAAGERREAAGRGRRDEHVGCEVEPVGDRADAAVTGHEPHRAGGDVDLVRADAAVGDSRRRGDRNGDGVEPQRGCSRRDSPAGEGEHVAAGLRALGDDHECTVQKRVCRTLESCSIEAVDAVLGGISLTPNKHAIAGDKCDAIDHGGGAQGRDRGRAREADRPEIGDFKGLHAVECERGRAERER